MVMEQEVMGLSPGNHVMTFYRAALQERGIAGSAEVSDAPNGRRVRAAGLLVVHQSPPTAKGFHFLTLEDEDGMTNVVVRPDVYEQYQHIIHGHRLLLVAGEVQQEGGSTNLLAKWIAPLPAN
jgi:error-prone DNA polymerase